MKKIVLIKENGIVRKASREKLISSKPYLSTSENCLDINESNIESIKEETTIKIRKLINHMIVEILKVDGGETAISKLIYQLKIADSKESVLEVTKKLIAGYNHIFSSNRKGLIIEEKVKELPELTASVTIKSLISNYFRNMILKLGKDRVEKLEKIKLNGHSIEEILKMLGEQFPEESKANGIYNLFKKVLNDTIDEVFDELQIHLCWEYCTNACITLCQKVNDLPKNNIGTYDFITDGYQTFDEKGNLDKFVVTGCTNYKKSQPKKIPLEEIKRRKNNLIMMYFDAESVEEAYKEQERLILKGELKNIRGKLPSAKEKTKKKK